MPTQQSPICDFCSAPIPTWEIPAGDFEGAGGVGSRGAWAACDECYSIIERATNPTGPDEAQVARAALTKRSVDTFYERQHEGGVTSQNIGPDRPAVERALRKVHDEFWKNRSGTPRRMLSVEAARQLRDHYDTIVEYRDSEGMSVAPTISLNDEDREQVVRYLKDEFDLPLTNTGPIAEAPPLARSWQDVLDLQVDLWRWWDGAVGHAFGLGMKGSLDKRGVRTPSDMAKSACYSLATAEPISVSEQVMDVVGYAVQQFEPEPLYAPDLWTPSGFAVLPRAHHIVDHRGQRLSIAAFHWSPMEGANRPPNRDRDVDPTGPEYAEGTYFWLYGDRDDPLDDVSMRLAAEKANPLQKVRLHLTHATGWFYGRRPPQEGDEDYSERELWKFLQCFFRIGQERIVAREQRTPQRPVRRRAERAGHEARKIMVVTLRRTRQPSEPGDGNGRQIGAEFQYPVRGHWRWQWYPSTETHRQKWIAEFLKGNPDKPVRGPLRAWRFKR